VCEVVLYKLLFLNNMDEKKKKWRIGMRIGQVDCQGVELKVGDYLAEKETHRPVGQIRIRDDRVVVGWGIAYMWDVDYTGLIKVAIFSPDNFIPGISMTKVIINHSEGLK
jgi:hypothetical protein